MPRGPRLDAPGGLHHVMARGVSRQALFREDVDRDDFAAIFPVDFELLKWKAALLLHLPDISTFDCKLTWPLRIDVPVPTALATTPTDRPE